MMIMMLVFVKAVMVHGDHYDGGQRGEIEEEPAEGNGGGGVRVFQP